VSDLVYTPAELAEQFGCDVRIVDRLIAEGRVPHVRISARKVVIPRQALVEWLEDEARASTLLFELEHDGVHHGLNRQGAA
jgi:excisionase family DNA binding protein